MCQTSGQLSKLHQLLTVYPLSLHRSDCNPFKEVLLQAEEQNKHWNCRNRCPCHHWREVSRIRKTEALQTDLDRLHIKRICYQEWPDEIIPCGHERQER